MMSNTKRGSEVRQYFEKVEKLLNKYKDHIIKILSDRINVLENNQKPIIQLKSDVIYFIRSNLLPDDVFKLGKSKKFKQRLLSHNSSHADNLEVALIFETKNIDQVESCVKIILKKYQYKRRKEIYQVDIDILKEVLQNCDELVSRTENKIKKRKEAKLTRTKDSNYNYFLYFDKDAN